MSEPQQHDPVINAFWSGSVLYLTTLSKDGTAQRRKVPAEHVGFVRRADIDEKIARGLRSDGRVASMREEGEFVRIRFRDKWSARDILRGRDAVDGQAASGFECRANVRTYEGDVGPVARYLADTLAPIAKPRRCYLDLETDSRKQIVEMIEGKARVLAWALVGVDDEGNIIDRVVGILSEDTNAAERDLLLDLWHEVSAYEQIVSWNLDGFDKPVLINRSKAMSINVEERDYLWMDQMLAFKKMNASASESGDEKQSAALDAVAHAVLGRGKTEGADGAHTWELWCENRDLLAEYVLNDTELMPAIEEVTGYLALHQTICEVCGVLPDTWSLAPSKFVDGYMLRRARARGTHFESKWKDDVESGGQFLGAYVMEPRQKGFIHDVHVCDFASLYPSIIITWNMSPETWAPEVVLSSGARPTYLAHSEPQRFPIPPGHCASPDDQVFRTDSKGMIVEALEELITLRKKWKKIKNSLPPGTKEWKEADRRTSAYKIAANSFYGVLGLETSRYYVREVAQAVTQAGAFLIKEVMREVEARGWKAVYGDTDSVFVTGCSESQFKEFVAWCNAELFPKIVERYRCPTNFISLSFEKTFARLVMLSKKRYCCPPEAPVWMGDLSFKKLGDIRVGDEVIGWAQNEKNRRRLKKSKVVRVGRRMAQIVKVTMASGKTLRCTPDHQWLRAREVRSSRGNKRYRYKWQTVEPGRELMHVIDQPAELSAELQRDADWLGGIWDGEGSLCNGNRGQIVIAQSPVKNPEVCARIEQVFKRLGFQYSVHAKHHADDCNRYALRGDKQHKVDFLTWCRPAKSDRLAPAVLKSWLGEGDKIISVEPDGYGEVVSLTTETGNYIAWGYASKNCGRYSMYEGTAATEKSKPEVKGLEYKRGDTARLARTMQAEVLDLMIGGGILTERSASIGEDDAARYQDLVAGWKQHVLEGQLDLRDIRLSKSLSKDPRAYQTPPPHVRVAVELQKRGLDMRAGSRVEYVVMDASVSPMRVIPAQDFVGEFDRHYLWEDLVWPPTERLLEAAFPGKDWKPYGRSRPAKLRGKAARAAEAEAAGQSKMFQ